MRTFTYANGRLRPGFAFRDLTGITVGARAIRFDESLIHSPIAAFGQHIVNADLAWDGGKRAQPLTLVAPKHNMWVGDNEGAMLAILLSRPEGTRVEKAAVGNTEVVFLDRNEVVDPIHYDEVDPYITEVAALVVLRYNSSLTLSMTNKVEVSPSFVEKLKGVKATEYESSTAIRFSFDGKEVKVETL
jgi:hypothetical protein